MNYNNEIAQVENQLSFYEEALLAIVPDKIGYNELTSVIGPILKFNLETGNSIVVLARNNHLRDLIILSRPFIEGLINVGFICARGNDAVIQSKKYAYQRGYRDLFRHIDFGDFRITVGMPIEKKDLVDKNRPQQLIEAINEFTGRNGKEIVSWTPETTKEKVAVIGKKYGEWVYGLLTFAFFNIYKDVSEIIHGSYYGVLIFTGMQNKIISEFKSSDEAAEYFTNYQFKLATLILQQLSISIAAMIDVLSQEFSSIEFLKEIRRKSNNALTGYANNIDS